MTEVCRPIPRYLEDNSFFHHAVHVARGFLGLCWKQFAGAFRLERRVLTRTVHRSTPSQGNGEVTQVLLHSVRFLDTFACLSRARYCDKPDCTGRPISMLFDECIW